mmetsp:Transcript_122288/g.391236  ORF Transcript_122288/g.391236 Transcript_122288/m.391236 type:complete len:242 (-) Transcript_122288:225-950(-)
MELMTNLAYIEPPRIFWTPKMRPASAPLRSPTTAAVLGSQPAGWSLLQQQSSMALKVWTSTSEACTIPGGTVHSKPSLLLPTLQISRLAFRLRPMDLIFARLTFSSCFCCASSSFALCFAAAFSAATPVAAGCTLTRASTFSGVSSSLCTSETWPPTFRRFAAGVGAASEAPTAAPAAAPPARPTAAVPAPQACAGRRPLRCRRAASQPRQSGCGTSAGGASAGASSKGDTCSGDAATAAT